MNNYFKTSEESTKRFELLLAHSRSRMQAHNTWTDAHEHRLRRETKAFKQAGCVDACLAVRDICYLGLTHEVLFLSSSTLSQFTPPKAQAKYARGRCLGAAAGSLVCYLLGMTYIDPVKHGLYFERFFPNKTRSRAAFHRDIF